MTTLRWQGLLDRTTWVEARLELSGFALVLEPASLGADPARWEIAVKGWIDSPALVGRLRDSVEEEDWTAGKFSIDPTRYLALCFGQDCYLAKLADVTPGSTGMLILDDGAMSVSEDLRLVLEESYSIEGYSVYDEP